jgi:hypothetical protein
MNTPVRTAAVRILAKTVEQSLPQRAWEWKAPEAQVTKDVIGEICSNGEHREGYIRVGHWLFGTVYTQRWYKRADVEILSNGVLS